MPTPQPQFSASDFSPVPSTGFNASDFTPVDTSVVPTENKGFVQNSKDRLSTAINNDKESVTDFASRKASENIFGIKPLFPATADDLNAGPMGGAQDPNTQDWGAFGGLKIPAKTAANILTDLPHLAADVGNFAWQVSFNAPETLKNIAQDPIGFAEGMVGDLVTQPLSGLSTGIKDLFTGQGAGKAAQDIGEGFQKGMVAFIDRPITSIIQLKLAKGLATDPIGTTKQVVKDTVDMGTKPWQLAAKFVKDPVQAAKDIGNTVQAKYDAIKNLPRFFTKEGQTKIAQGMGNQIMEYAQNNLKITDLQNKLKSLDINSADHAQTLSELNMYKQKVENAQSSVSLLTSAMGEKMGETFSKGGYSNTGEFVSDTANIVDNLYKSKDLNGALNPKGQPVKISDVSSVTSYLRDQGKMLEAKDNPDGKLFQRMADDLELRHNITQAGGEQGYINKLVDERLKSEGIDPVSKPAKYDLARQTFFDEAKTELDKKIESKPSFYTRDLTASDLYDYMTGKHGEASTPFGRKLMSNQNDTSVPTSHSITLDTINKDIANVDPTAPERLAAESKKSSEISNMWSKWKDKTFSNVGDMINFITKDTNWEQFKNFPQEVIQKFQNTLTSHIIDISKKTDGTIDFNKLTNNTNKYSKNLTVNHTGPLAELSYTNNLPESISKDQRVGSDLKNVMEAKGELTSAENQVKTSEEKAADLEKNMKIVGTTPEKIATNLKNIETMDDLNSFMKAANIEDPKQLGDMITGVLFDQMQQQFGSNKGINFEQITKLVQQVKDIGDKSPLGEQLKDALFSKEKQNALEALEEQSSQLTDMFDSKGFTPGVKRLFHAAFGAAASVLGWHVTAMRSFFDAVKPDASKEKSTVPNSENLKKMGSETKKKNGIVPRIIKSIPKTTPGAEGINNLDQEE